MLTIRYGDLNDLAQVGKIEIAAATLFPENRIPQPHESLPEKVLIEAIKNQLLFCVEKVCVEKEDELVGFASCHIYRKNLHLDEISVHSDHGKQGIGTKLLEKVLEEKQKRQLKACTLTTFEDIPWNAPFYQKHGFEILEEKNVPRHVAAMLREERSLGLKKRVAMLFR
jgi:ribosomal protein S18 acetylase RimI-like enzyme